MQLVAFVGESGLPSYVVLSTLFIAYLILGCFVEPLSLLILSIPIVFPMTVSLGVDPILFGVLIVLLQELALITPPVGINVFVIAGIAKDVPMYTIFRGISFFLAAAVFVFALLMAFPEIALFLPRLMG